VVDAAERIVEQANECQALAAWHDEHATAGTPSERQAHEQAAFSYRIVELSLRLVAAALDEELAA
jgi:hypothetical protein